MQEASRSPLPQLCPQLLIPFGVLRQPQHPAPQSVAPLVAPPSQDSLGLVPAHFEGSRLAPTSSLSWA